MSITSAVNTTKLLRGLIWSSDILSEIFGSPLDARIGAEILLTDLQASRGLSTHSIATTTGIPYETVRRHLERMLEHGLVFRGDGLAWQLSVRTSDLAHQALEDIARVCVTRVIGSTTPERQPKAFREDPRA